MGLGGFIEKIIVEQFEVAMCVVILGCNMFFLVAVSVSFIVIAGGSLRFLIICKILGYLSG